eukprot:5502050-Amphidinium_carterae.1
MGSCSRKADPEQLGNSWPRKLSLSQAKSYGGSTSRVEPKTASWGWRAAQCSVPIQAPGNNYILQYPPKRNTYNSNS